MHRLGPSQSSIAAIVAVANKAVARVDVPVGYFHEYVEEIRGYIPCMLRLTFTDETQLILGADVVCPLPDERVEFAVLSATEASQPHEKWQKSSLLSDLLSGKTLGEPNDFTSDEATEDASGFGVAVPTGWRFPSCSLELLGFTPSLPIGCMALRSAALPKLVEQPTGKLSWSPRMFPRGSDA